MKAGGAREIRSPTPIIVLPARINSSRVARKPLLDIDGMPLILRLWEAVREAAPYPAIVASDSREVCDLVEGAGGLAVYSSDSYPSGSDRAFAAVQIHDPSNRFDTVVNVQADMPFIEKGIIEKAVSLLEDGNVDVGTLVYEVHTLLKTSDVKLVGTKYGEQTYRSLYFTRADCPWGSGPRLKHYGIYAWRRSSLAAFFDLEPSMLELRESLEQLRALEAGMRIDAHEVFCELVSIDTPDDIGPAVRKVRQRRQTRDFNEVPV